MSKSYRDDDDHGAGCGCWECITFPADDPAYGVTIASATTADELLSALADIAPENRETALLVRGVKILREAADLCGVGDAETLTKRSAAAAIVRNF